MADVWAPINGVYTAAAEPLMHSPAWLEAFDGALFFTTIVGALAGAWVGAWAAQRIAKQGKQRDELLAELRSVDVAISLCSSVTDVAGALKIQWVSKLQSEHKSDLDRFEAYKAEKPRNAPFFIQKNYVTLQTIAPPIALLQELVVKEMSISPNGIRSMTAAADAVSNLNGMIGNFNALIEMFRDNTLPDGFTSEHYYLAIPVKGVTNEQYASTLRGIADLTDNVLFFSNKLMGCLTERGVKVRDRYEKLTKERHWVRKANSFDEGLIPPDEAYAPWMRGWEPDFSEAIKKPRWWHRKQK